MLCGVAFFSYIMGSFIEIISNYREKMGVIDKSKPMRKWMTLLTRYTNNKPLSRKLTNQIEHHFAYFWQHDRLASITQHYKTLNELPKSMKRRLMTNYLFEDIFFKFRHFFYTDENRESKFLYDVAFGFMPRYFDATDEEEQILYDEEDEVPEMYFVLEGKIGIGYTLAGRGRSKQSKKLAKYFKGEFFICEHYVVNNRRCEYLFLVVKSVKCFALSKTFFKKIFDKYPEIGN